MERKKNLSYNLYLIGFMGAGKSRLGGTIARIYRMEAVDTDRLIEKAEGMSVVQIYQQKGRAYFEEREQELMERLGARKGLVVSCGGETPLSPGNQAVLKRGRTVYVRTSPEEILKRVRRRHTRPLIEDKSDEDILEMMRERQSLYEALADITVETEGKTGAETAAEIMGQLF